MYSGGWLRLVYEPYTGSPRSGALPDPLPPAREKRPLGLSRAGWRYRIEHGYTGVGPGEGVLLGKPRRFETTAGETLGEPVFRTLQETRSHRNFTVGAVRYPDHVDCDPRTLPDALRTRSEDPPRRDGGPRQAPGPDLRTAYDAHVEGCRTHRALTRPGASFRLPSQAPTYTGRISARGPDFRGLRPGRAAAVTPRLPAVAVRTIRADRPRGGAHEDHAGRI